MQAGTGGSAVPRKPRAEGVANTRKRRAQSWTSGSEDNGVADGVSQDPGACRAKEEAPGSSHGRVSGSFCECGAVRKASLGGQRRYCQGILGVGPEQSVMMFHRAKENLGCPSLQTALLE